MTEQLNITSKQSNGGKIMAIRQREEALKKYYANPNKCKYCNAIIEVKDNQKVPEVRRKKFCNQSCNAKQTNTNRGVGQNTRVLSETDILYPTKHPRKKNARPLAIYKIETSINKISKGDLFKNRSNWQNARSAIQKHSRPMYFNNTSHKHCCRIGCTYDIHVDVAHIKPVCEFSDESTIEEINNINNLIGLCKNHHWEFDNGYITLDDIDTTNKKWS